MAIYKEVQGFSGTAYLKEEITDYVMYTVLNMKLGLGVVVQLSAS